MLELPNDLRDAIAQALAKVSQVRWMREAQALSERYRASRNDRAQPLATGMDQVLGYAALIMPATYAQLCGAMAATAVRIPSWTPRTLLDIGSGPGTTFWAAMAQWPSLQSLTGWERETSFIKLGRELANSSRSSVIQNARWEHVDLHQIATRELHLYDVVVIGHVLNELSSEAQKELLTQAWRMTEGVLLIVEPGTAEAFETVRAARDQLLGLDARTIAPCPHDRPCPLENDWCHFPQRLKRPDFQRRARGALSEWEDSKFSYAALARFTADQPIWGRVIREPTSNKAYAEAKISAQTGVARYRALKRYRELFRQVKQLEWGAALSEPLPEGIQVAQSRKDAKEDIPE